MKFGINVTGDNRNINVTIGAKKEEGEPDFFDGFKKDFLELNAAEDDDLLIEQVEDEE